VEFEEPADVLRRFPSTTLRVSKLHFSSALRFKRRRRRAAHCIRLLMRLFPQVITRATGGALTRYRDLDVALNPNPQSAIPQSDEWRIHFHIPLHCAPTPLFSTTSDHLLGVMDALAQIPSPAHTRDGNYTWEVMPAEMRTAAWSISLWRNMSGRCGELRQRGLA